MGSMDTIIKTKDSKDVVIVPVLPVKITGISLKDGIK